MIGSYILVWWWLHGNACIGMIWKLFLVVYTAYVAKHYANGRKRCRGVLYFCRWAVSITTLWCRRMERLDSFIFFLIFLVLIAFWNRIWTMANAWHLLVYIIINILLITIMEYFSLAILYNFILFLSIKSSFSNR